MRKLSLLALLCMIAMLAFAPAVWAQSRGPSGADGTFNCPDFDTQADAQAVLRSDPTDPNGLDGGSDNGIACESLPGPTDMTPVPGAIGGGTSTPTPMSTTSPTSTPMSTPTATPAATVTPSGTSLPDTGGASFSSLAAGSLLLLVGGGLMARRLARA
jgi:LPXTG-motif cell wall-anchored protein